MQTLEGTQLGNYDVIRRLRVGGMGAVYEGRQRTAFGRRVAIKVILGSYATDREMRRRFAREARTIAQLHHPHILPLIEFGDERGLLYLVMPFIEGGTLTSYLRHALPDLQDISTIFLQLLDAVEYAHDEGLIHRDIKSSNVLLDTRRGGTPYAYLADFGLVRTSQNLELEETGKPIPLDQVPGTPHYMAPEQTRGIVSTATDIYALGVLLYQMLIGELPYDDPDDIKVAKMHLYSPVPSPCERDASIPFELGEVVRKAMAKRPDQRFSNIAQMRAAFLAAIEGPVAHVTEDDPEIDFEASPPLPPPPQIPRRASMPLSSAEAPQVPLRRASMPLSSAEAPQTSLPRPAPVKQVKRRSRIAPPVLPPARPRAAKKARVKRRRLALAVVVATLVPVILLLLLIVPRVLGVYLFPAGFPVIGAPAIATVSVTVKSQTIQDSYLLMASPEVTRPDLTTRAIPDRQVSVTVSSSRQTATSGTQTQAGAQASGLLLFDNSSHRTFPVQEGTQFSTGTGIQVMLTQSVTVPPMSNGTDGTVFASAVASVPGVAGNIAANALNTTCCNDQVTVSNPQPFTGGADPHVVHIVAQADLDGVRNALTPGLQREALQKILGQIAANEVAASSPAFITQVISNKAVGTPADLVSVQVNMTATETVYNPQTARQVAEQLLGKEAAQTPTLSSSYQLKDGLSVATPVITSRGNNGVIYLSVAARGLWVYNLTQQQVDAWRQSIKGATLQLAQTFLKAQPGVASVQIQLPFGADHLPTSIDQISMVLVNV